MARVVVVGAGIGGLTAARALAADHEVTVLEGASEIGGKLRTAEVGGVVVDVGAEAMLQRRPEGIALARDLGLSLVDPTGATSRVWVDGALHPLPRSLMGVPADLDELAASGVLSAAGMDAVRREASRLAAGPIPHDVSIGDLVADRLGDEVVERLVEPLLGGVYAGHAREISARAALPQLIPMAERGSLVAQAAALPRSDTPVFASLAGGMGGLASALAAGLEIRTATTVRELRRRADGGFDLVVGSAASPETITADRVVLATPAAPAARLLRDLAPRATAELARIEHASVAVVTLALPVTALGAAAFDGTASGFLVPPAGGLAIKASTFSFAKWDWVRAAGDAHGVALLRTSLGRHREETALQATDEELVARSLTDLHTVTGLTVTPVDTHVQRWGGGLPQYAVGHLDRVARIRDDVARVPGLAVCGAAYDGVGIPAVIASAQRAVDDLTAARD